MILSRVILALLLSVTAFASESSKKESTIPANDWSAQHSGHNHESVHREPSKVAPTPTVVGHSHEEKGQEPAQVAKDYYLPQHEEQVTVYPPKDDSREDDVLPPLYYPPFYPIQWVQPTLRPITTTRRPPTLPTITPRPRPTRPPRPTTTTPISGGGANVQVLENYQIISENGIIEYKLRLSNGLIDHKRITKKRIGNKIIYVQTGYYSTPVDPTRNQFNLIFYIADELGFRVTGVQYCSNEQPCRPRNE